MIKPIAEPKPRCANCRFWHVWRQVMLTDDEPKMLGHCVIAAPMGLRHLFPTIQGLTAEDFHCGAYHAPEEENAALREADFVNAVSLTMRRNPVAE